MTKIIRRSLIVLGLLSFFLPWVMNPGVVLAKKSNPPGPKGGLGTNWVNPPGPKGGPPGAGTYHPAKQTKWAQKNWWLPQKPYRQWERHKLMERLEGLEEYKSELMARGADIEMVESVTEQIENIKEILNP